MAVREREREGADIGGFISLEEPTRGMVKDAASAGFYESPNGKKFPRVQLLTIGDLLKGKDGEQRGTGGIDLGMKVEGSKKSSEEKRSARLITEPRA